VAERRHCLGLADRSKVALVRLLLAADRVAASDHCSLLAAHSGSLADAAAMRVPTPKQGRSRAGGHGRVSRLPPRSRDGSPGGSCGNRRLRREWEAPFDGSMCRPASRLRHGFRSSSPPRFPLGVLSYDLSPASLQTVEAGSYARPGNPPIARSRTPSGPGRILRRAVDPTRMMWSASSLYRWPSTCTSAEPRSAI